MTLYCSLRKKHTHSHSKSTYFGSKSTLQLPCNVANMELTFPDIVHEFLVGHQTSLRTAKPAPQAQEHWTNHKNHWTKADQNLEESAGQDNCWSVLNTASDADSTA